MLDYDGTLAEIAPTPKDATLRPEVRRLLRELGRMPHLHLGFVSGRALKDLKQQVSVPRAAYAGSHGMEFYADGKQWSLVNRAQRAVVAEVRKRVDELLRDEPGLYIESKPYSVALHYRRASPEESGRIRRKALEASREYSGKVVVQTGKKILELLPALEATKGTGVRTLLKLRPFRRCYPLYLGDDVTDETAFRALGPKSLTIVVGPAGKRSAAQFRLSSPGEVELFLRRLKELRS